jgi:sec-independent protein translocase protein TatA
MGISIWQLLVILAIVALLFGTRRLGTIGEDLGRAIKGFRNAMREEEPPPARQDRDEGKVIEGEVQPRDEQKS